MPMKDLLRIAGRSLATQLRHLPGNSTQFGPPRREVQRTIENDLPNCAVVSLRSRMPVRREMPTHADPPIAMLFSQMQDACIKEQFVASFNRGRYWGRCYGYILNAQDQLHRDLSPGFADVSGGTSSLATHDAFEQPFLPPVADVAGTVAVVNTLFSHNFHHWLLDCVPRLGLLQDAGWDLNHIDAFILPDPLSRWHREVLDRLAIPAGNIIGSHSHLHLRAEKLLVPSFSEPSRQPELFNYTPEGIEFVRRLFLSEQKVIGLPKRIIVSREKANSRRLDKGDILCELLGPFGFHKVLLEDLSLADQALLFHSATTIIMPTGGGLANLAFCQPCTQVVELFDPSYLPTFSFVLSQQLGLRYHALVGLNHTNGSGHSDSGGQNDMSFYLNELADYILSIL